MGLLDEICSCFTIIEDSSRTGIKNPQHTLYYAKLGALSSRKNSKRRLSVLMLSGRMQPGKLPVEHFQIENVK
jgi:hypothetical protein